MKVSGILCIVFSAIIISMPSQVFAQNQEFFPKWIPNVNKMWSKNQISDQEFINVYKYLIDKKILVIYDTDYSQDLPFEKQLDLTKHIASYFDANSYRSLPIQSNASNYNFVPIKNRFVYIEHLPDYYNYSDNIIPDATVYWMKSDNVRFNLVSNPSDAVITVKWLKETNLPESGYTIGNKFVEIGLGDTRCGGIWHPYNQSFVSEVLRHELGHILGYQHSTNPLDVMYPIINDKKYTPLVNTTNSQQGC